MSWINQITDVLQNYAQGGAGAAAPADVTQHYNQVAQAAPASELASSLAGMFRSDQTPPFAQMVGQLFGNSNGDQRAGLLNTLMSSTAGAGIVSQIAQAAGVPLGTGTNAQITPEAAAKITPEAVQQAAAQTEQHDPSIVERVSQLYAQHPALINTLGTVAMSMAMSQLANRRR